MGEEINMVNEKLEKNVKVLDQLQGSQNDINVKLDTFENIRTEVKKNTGENRRLISNEFLNKG